mgnify:CR=1 FL=1
MKEFLKKNWKKVVAVGILLLLIIIVVSGKGGNNSGVSKYTIETGDVVNTLLLSGEVEPVQEVRMAFSVSGKADRVYKNVGDKVYCGEKIVELDNASLRADLADAEANLSLEKAQYNVSNAELDIAVEKTRTKLLSDGLVAYTKSGDTSNTAPEISGSYTGNVEGEYRIGVEYSNAPSRRDITYSGLEKGQEEVLLYKAVPLGNNGLYIKFEEGEISIGETWRVTIPNVEGPNYVENLNAYKSALASRDAAENQNISKDINNARIKQAEAQVAKIRAEIEERTLRATFPGIVGNIDIKEGEIAESGKVLAKILSEDSYHVVVQVPEVDVVNLVAEQSADILLDAYGSEAIFLGKVLSVDPSETEVDGVSVYEARIGFDETDARIRSGMTADVRILKEKKVGVLRLPRRFIDKDETGQFVLVENIDESTDKVYIILGLEGSDGFVEVVSGVKVGDVVIGEFEE